MPLSKPNEDILQTLISMADAGTLSGVFQDIPAVVYNDPRCPGVRSGLIKGVVEASYAHYLAEQGKTSRALFFGSAFHAYASDLAEFNADYKADCKPEEIVKIGTMFKNMKRHPDVIPRMRNALFEATFFSRCPVTGLLKRCRVDLMDKDLAVVDELNDFKTCASAAPAAFAKDARWFMYRISAAFYLGIVSEVLGRYVRNFNLIACEKEEPFECSVYRVDDRSISIGEEECLRGLRTMERIYRDGESAWLGYELGVKDLAI